MQATSAMLTKMVMALQSSNQKANANSRSHGTASTPARCAITKQMSTGSSALATKKRGLAASHTNLKQMPSV